MKDKALRAKVSMLRQEVFQMNRKIDRLADKLGYEFYDQPEQEDLIRKKRGRNGKL